MRDVLAPAGLARRLAAMFYDCLLLFGVECAVTAIVMAMHVAQEGSEAIIERGRVAVNGPLLQIALLVTWLTFFCWFWTRGGQTLGMQAWRIRIETLDGEPPGWRAALLRLAGAVASAVCFGAGYWWMLVDAEQRTWHDRWSGTRVVRLSAK